MRRIRLALFLIALGVAATGLLAGRAGEPARPGPPPRGVPADAVEATVDHVTDGDTLWLSGIGKVRLIGIDTPEVYGQVECYGPEASAFAKRLLPPGRGVSYELGREERDRYGRALAYVWLDNGRFLNRTLAELGYATPLTIPPNDDYAPLFAAASSRARRAQRGLWGQPGCG